VRLLLDTHVLLWWRDDSPRLSPRAQGEIADPTNEIHVSTATLWEIIIKRGLGKLSFLDDLEDVVREESFGLMPISFQHLRRLETLPGLHRTLSTECWSLRPSRKGCPLSPTIAPY
jgi:PIN domain nuclease of toxin-antitoxin system